MEIKNIINQKSVINPIAHSSYNKTPIVYRDKISDLEANSIISEATELISNPDFKPYFYKTLYLIGKDRFRRAISEAKTQPDVNCRPCFFVHKLKAYRDIKTGQTGDR